MRFFTNAIAIAIAPLLLTAPGAQAQAVSPCSLLSNQEIAAATGIAAGKLTADEPGTLTSRDVPGLPASLRIEQCSGSIRASGAVTVRVGVLRAERELSAGEWRRVEKALEDPQDKRDPGVPTRVGAAACWTNSWQPKKQTLHEVGCGMDKGRWQLTLSFEHENAAQLPASQKVGALLEKAMARLPAR